MSEPSMGSLSESERYELEQLRREKALASAPAPDPNEPPKPIYWLHLANGEVIESAGQMTHYKGIQVIGCYPITEKEGE